MIVGLYIAVVLIGYLLGSIPFGLIIGRSFAKTDIRQVGSGKIGMTNVLRTAGKKAAALALLLDMGKGAAPVFLASVIFHTGKAVEAGSLTWVEGAEALAALAAISGHSWSIFLKFKGGRGVSTFIGGAFALFLPGGGGGGGGG